MRALLIAAALLSSTTQPWLLDPAESVVRRVHTGPADGRTTIWIRLKPRMAGGAAGPTDLVFVAEFPGRSAPADVPVRLHVMSDVRVSPLVPRVPRLELSVDDGVVLDLLAPSEGAVLAHCCGELISPIPIGATVTLRPERLDELAGASTVTGNALGVPFVLSAAEVASIRAFRSAIRNRGEPAGALMYSQPGATPPGFRQPRPLWTGATAAALVLGASCACAGAAATSERRSSVWSGATNASHDLHEL